MFNFLSMGFFTAMVFFGFFWANIDEPPSKRLPTWGAVGALAVLAGLWYMFVLRLTRELIIRDDNTVEFRSFLRRKTVQIADILSIEYSVLSAGVVELKYTGGTIYLDNHVDGFYDFIATLKSLNARVVVKGC